MSGWPTGAGEALGRGSSELEVKATYEDMVDTGLTLNFIAKMIRLRQPSSLAIATLFNREANRLAWNLPIRYSGFEAPDDFLVGYGLDYREQFRNLPYVAILKKEIYAL